MRKQLKFLFIALGSLVLVSFVLFVFNQVAQAYVFTKAIHPLLGQAVLWGLIALFTGLLVVPVVLFYRLPKPMVLPSEAAHHGKYVQELGRRLSKNALLKALPIDYGQEEGVQQALQVLHARADQIIQTTARSVFLTTAISQNGKLDALTVFMTHTKMVWDVAHVYYQRPAPRDMIALYANVGAATFLATQIEDLDISEQLEPVIGTVIQNSALKSVPFVGSVSSVLVDSLMEGTVNAFLTLRVGVLTKRYCSSLTPFDAKTARKAALREASSMLKGIVLQTSGQVVSSIMRATRKAGADTVSSGVKAVGNATTRVKNSLTGLVGKLKRSEE